MNRDSVGPLTWVVVLGAVIALLLCIGPAPTHAQDQNNIPGVHTLQVTIGASTTRVSSTSIPVKQLFIQNNAAHNIRVGDSLTSSSRGALIVSGSPGGSITSGAFGVQTATDLNQWFINGTQNDVIDVIYIQ
jgi:hypothetical protein